MDLTLPLPPDPYKILGVAKDAQLPEIRSAHRKLALKWHPDRVENAILKRVNQHKFHQVQQAYDLLSDDLRRSQHDDHVKLSELRKEMISRDLPSTPLDYEIEIGGPTWNTRSIRKLTQIATDLMESYENVSDERVKGVERRSPSCKLARDGDQKRHFTSDGEHATMTPRMYTTQTLPRSLEFKEEMKRARDNLTAKLKEEQLRDKTMIESLSRPISQLPRPQPPPKVYPRSQSTQEVIAPSQDVPSRRFRRGRGARQVVGVNGSDDPNDPDFFVRDVEIRSRNGSPNLARCRLDSQCEVPLLVSEHWARENDKWPAVSSDFRDPGMQSVSGHKIKVNGILRNMVFNLRGSTVTYRRDVYVCQQLDLWADMVFGAKFIAEQFPILFSKAKKMFAGIFGFRKESAEEKVRGKVLQDDADRQAAEQERKRRAKKEREAREKEEARNRVGEEHQRRQTGQ